MLWWCTAILALFTGAVCCAGLFGTAVEGYWYPNAESFWETEKGYTLLQQYSNDELLAWESQQWNPALVTRHDTMEQSQLMSYELRFVDQNGNTLKKLYQTTMTENGPVYRVYVQVEPDDSYYTLGACTFRGEKQDPFYWRDRGVLWQSGSDAVTLKSININGEETPQTPAEQLRYAIFDLYIDSGAMLTKTVSTAAGFNDTIQRELILFTWFQQRFPWFITGLILAALLGFAAVVMLWLGAGRNPDTEKARLCWFDRIPMEIQLFGLLFAAFGCVPFLSLAFEMRDSVFYWQNISQIPQICQNTLSVIGLILAVYGTLVLVVLLSLVRWGKQGNPLRAFLCVRGLGYVWNGLRIWANALPLVWGCTLLMGLAGLFILFLLGAFYYGAPMIPLLAGLFLWLAVYACFVYIARALRALKIQTERFLTGDYAAKSDFKFYLPELRAISDNLGRMNEGMQKAVDEQLKAERMKTELITNVSHDLKTPLTSIINYTDLLQKEELPPQAASYAQIIAKQGQRLHKLTLDLVEASKAASGVLQCDKKPTLLNELCQQAVGEYTERLEKARLIPVLELPETEVTASIDGRLTWRILDNLLSNACKYAQPGTRVYLVLSRYASSVSIQVKNISREPLNMPAEELMERFVRGDTSRSSEGSGLGLAIARSLAELQGGRFGLYINGDLFQAEIVFPCMDEEIE